MNQNNAQAKIHKQEATPHCAENLLNRYEVIQKKGYPEGDVFPEIQHGMIAQDWNKGLRLPQAKLMSAEVYNSGCFDAWGCVGNSSFYCPYGEQRKTESKIYPKMNEPLLSGAGIGAKFEHLPPSFKLPLNLQNVGPRLSGWPGQ